MTDDTQADGGRDDAGIIALIPEGDGELESHHDAERARERAAELWADRGVTHVEADGAGDGDSVEVGKDGFLATFSVSVDHRGVGVSPVGYATFEVHDDRGYFILEDIEVEADGALLAEMDEAVQGVVDAHREHRARDREFRNAVL